MNNATGEFQAKPRGALVKQWPMFIDDLGTLMPVEFSEMPFQPKRIFTVTDCPAGEYRGGHAHRETQQYLFCLKGIIRVLLINKAGQRDIELHRGYGTLIDKMTWDKLQFLTGNDVLLVLCNTAFDKNDYIENFEEFKKLLNDENNGRHHSAE